MKDLHSRQKRGGGPKHSPVELYVAGKMTVNTDALCSVGEAVDQSWTTLSCHFHLVSLLLQANLVETQAETKKQYTAVHY